MTASKATHQLGYGPDWATAVRPPQHLPGALGEQLLAVGSDLFLWRNVSVEGLAGDAEFGS